MDQLQQDDLLQRLRRDDRSAMKQLFALGHSTVHQTIYRYVREENLTKDLSQEVFIRFWNKRHDIVVSSSLLGYLRRMAVNEALAHLRRKKNMVEESEIPLSTGDNVEEGYLHQELEQQIHAAIQTLPPRCRTIFQLSRFEEMTYKEIGEQLDISVKTVENQMGKALRILREALARYRDK